MTVGIEDFRLSPNFTFNQLTFTPHEDLQEFNRTFVTEAELRALENLCQRILEPIRTMFRVPIIVQGGFRCAALNERLGGTDQDQHRKGEAVDFHVRGLDDAAGIMHTFERIRRSTIPFGQIIDEFDGRRRWIHISLGTPYRPPMACGLALRMRLDDDGKREYVPVIE